MSAPTCATCRHFRPPDIHSSASWCRRYPATVGVTADHVCGEHAPAEPVGVPQLPDGWAWDNAEHVTGARYSANTTFYARVYRSSGMVDMFNAPLAVVEAVIAAHRARGGA